MSASSAPLILIANPSPDVYGSDLQMLESVSAMIERGWNVVVAMPETGALVDLLEARGAKVDVVGFPVLRRANASPLEFARMVLHGGRSVWALRSKIRRENASLVYVNTVTLPWWLIAARLARVPVVCHVHEAETQDGKVVRTALNAPLVLASAIIVISQSALTAMCEVAPFLRERSHLIYNGVPQPPAVPRPTQVSEGRAVRLAVVGRLSPRKAPHLAVEAVARLRQRGRNVVLAICGTPFKGYEWYEDELRRRADELELSQFVTWLGYVSPIWPVLEGADIVLAPSLREPFGNAVVEAQLSQRPVVATAALGHLETVTDGVTGLLVPNADVDGFVAAVERLLDDPSFAREVAEQGRAEALRRFSIERYREEVVVLLNDLIELR